MGTSAFTDSGHSSRSNRRFSMSAFGHKRPFEVRIDEWDVVNSVAAYQDEYVARSGDVPNINENPQMEV